MLQTLSLNLTNAALVPVLAAAAIVTTSLANTASADNITTNAALAAALNPVAHTSSLRTPVASRFTIYHQAGEDLHHYLSHCLTCPKTQKPQRIAAEHEKKPASQA